MQEIGDVSSDDEVAQYGDDQLQEVGGPGSPSSSSSTPARRNFGAVIGLCGTMKWLLTDTCFGKFVQSLAFLYLLKRMGILPIQIKVEKIEGVHLNVESIQVMPMEGVGLWNKVIKTKKPKQNGAE